jgi:hypothetical protein
MQRLRFEVVALELEDGAEGVVHVRVRVAGEQLVLLLQVKDQVIQQLGCLGHDHLGCAHHRAEQRHELAAVGTVHRQCAQRRTQRRTEALALGRARVAPQMMQRGARLVSDGGRAPL